MSLSFFWGKEKTTLATIMGFGIALGGLLLMTFQSVTTQDAPNPLLGNLLELVAMGFAAGYTTLSRYLGIRYSAFFLTATQMFIGTIFFAPAILFPVPHVPLARPFLPSLAIVYLGTGSALGRIVCTIMGYGKFQRARPRRMSI